MFVAVADDVKISRGIASHRRSSMRLIIQRIWFRSRYHSDQMFLVFVFVYVSVIRVICAEKRMKNFHK